MANLRIFLISLLLVSSSGNAQIDYNLPQVSPPTPNATSLHVYGNNSVNYYTGAVNVEIPLFEIEENGITVPITLKYTGGNGIKVQEISSWVGLGWTLNAGGAISRVRRGRADEDSNGGLFSLNNLPRPGDPGAFDSYRSICSGLQDAEPDKFFYNYPGNSGQFFFDHNQQYYLQPKKNILVDFQVNYVSGVPLASNPVSVFHNVIDKLKITGENGIEYFFEDKEFSNSIGLTEQYTDNRGFPSTWYLSQIKNPTGTSQVTFDYDHYRYSNTSMSGIHNNTSSEQESYTMSTYLAKRIKKINFTGGSVEFVTGTSNRKDLNDERYLEFIVIKNNLGEIIKKYKFSYKYFTANSLISDHSVLAVSNANRLVLTSVQEFSGDGLNSKPPHVFTYNTQNYLPHRDSKSIDHWGYFNGASNSKFEPRYYFTWFNITQGWVTDEFGSANREASPLHSKAGILTEVQYPTGDKTVFDYEGNVAANYSFFEENETGKGLVVSWQNQPALMEVINNDQPTTGVNVRYLKSPGATCYPVVYFQNITTGITSSLVFSYSYPTNQTIQLVDGQYNSWYVLHSAPYNTCNTQPDPIPITMIWTNVENNTSSPERVVGGLRIRSVRDFDSGIAITNQFFNYLGDNGLTSGYLVSNPVYAFLIKDLFDGFPYYKKRYANSLYPLETTQGSHVGYEKVTVTNDLVQSNGKTEYYYTTAKHFPDALHGVTPNGSAHDNYISYNGKKIPTFPVAEVDSRDFLRGMLTKKNVYANKSGIMEIVNSLEMSYKNLYYLRDNIGTHFQWMIDATETIEGLKVFSEDCNVNGYWKYYKLYSGYALPEMTVEKNFYGPNASIEETTVTEYEQNSDGLINWFNPNITKSINSKGERTILKTFYPRDVLNENSLGLDAMTVTQKNAIQALEADHRRSEPVQMNMYLDINNNGIGEASELMSSQRKVYKTENGLTLPSTVKTLQGNYNSVSNKLEDRINYTKYNNIGQPLEISRVDGSPIVYIWGYDNQFPVAKIENATYLEAIAFVDMSMINNSLTSDAAMRTELNKIRTGLANAGKNAMVTTYTYKPQVGVTSLTDPSGNIAYYTYDSLNRLQYIKDIDGKILKENKYNYANN